MVLIRAAVVHRLTLALLAIACSPSSIATAGEIWDGGGADSNWTTGANWNTTGLFQVRPPNNGTANIHFAGNDNTVPNVDIPYSIRSLTFDAGSVSFFVVGQELTIGAGGVTNNDNSGQVVTAPIKLAADQTSFAAAGPLFLGAVNLNGFDLTIGFILPNNTPTAFPTTLNNVISGVGNLTLPLGYPSTVTMSGSGSNTYVGYTAVAYGTLILQKSGEAIPGDLSVGGAGSGFVPAIVRLGANEQISHAPNARVTISAGGLLDLNGHTETVADLQLNEGAALTTGTGKLIVAESIFTSSNPTPGVATITGNLDLNAGMRTIDSNPTSTHLVLDGVVSNGGASFGGVIELRGAANTYSGLTIVEDAGTASLNKPAADGALRGDVTIRGNVILLRNEQILAAPGNEVLLENGGDLNLNGFAETVQDLTFKGGSVRGFGGTLSVLGTIGLLENGSGEIRARLNLQGARQFSIQGSAFDLELYDVVSNGSIVKSGPGRLELLNTANTYAGGTFINEGTVQASADGSLGAAAAPIHFDGGLLRVSGVSFASTSRTMTWGPNGGGFDVSSASGVFTISTQSFSGPGPLTKLGPGKLVLLAPQSYTGGTTVAAGTLEGNTLSLQGSILTQANATVSFNQSGDGVYAGNLSGTGGLAKLGAGTVLLSGHNTYFGVTTINAGALRLTGGNALGNFTDVTLANAAGVVLDLADSSETIGSLAGGGASGGNINLGSGTLTTGGNDTISTFAGVISGAGGIVKEGNGRFTPTGANTYSGGTTFAAGVLAASSDANLGHAAGPLRFDGGTLRANGAFGATSRSVELLAGGGGLEIANAAGSFTYAGNLTGAGGLNKLGAATLVLSGNNSYGGATTINGGTLRTVGGSAIPDGSAVTLTDIAGAVLDLNGASETIGSLAGGGPTGGNVSLGAATLTTGGDGSSATFAGAISGSGGLVKTGAGVFILTGNNVYTGLTDVQQGTLRLGANAAVPQNNSINVASGATFDLNGFSKTLSSLTGTGRVTLGAGQLTLGATDATSNFSGNISGSGPLVKIGAGTQTLDGANSYTGGTTVLAGRLRGPAGGLQGDIVNQAIVEFAQTSDGAYSGALSGAGSLIKTGPGQTTIATAATYTGATTVAEGTLTLLNTLNTSGGAIAIETGGTLAASGVVQRAIAGAGQLTAIGNLLAGDLTSNVGFDLGGVNVGSHSVVLLDADQVDLGGGTIAGGSLATLNGLELSGAFGGDGTVNGPLVNNGVVAGPAAPAALTFTGPVSGVGAFTGNIRILDSFSPGNSAAAASFEHLSLGDQALLTMELGGLAPGLQYDTLAATGAAMLDGALNVSLLGGFTPAAGDSFDILDWGSLSGTFSSLNLPTLGPVLTWNTSQLYTTGVLSVVDAIAYSADFDDDGDVDSADLAQWQGDFGENAFSDADDDGDSDGADFLAWQQQLGSGGAASSSTTASAAVPEPSRLALLAVAGSLLLPAARRM